MDGQTGGWTENIIPPLPAVGRGIKVDIRPLKSGDADAVGVR